MESPGFNFRLSPTQDDFVMCEARYPVIIGPEGEGKTWCGFAALFRHVNQCKPYLPIHPKTEQPIPMSAAIIRDTHVNLKRITVKGFERDFPGVVSFVDDCHRMIGPGIDADLFGMDAEDALSKIQGAEYDMIWIIEPAPILHTGNQGMKAIVYQTGMRRIRGRKTPKRLQVDMNPASLDHWTYSMFIRDADPETRVFRIKKGENKHLSETDRTARARAFKDRPDLKKRYDEGEFAAMYPGVAVTPEFSERLHLAEHWLMPIPGLECIRLWDGGLNPACIILQITPSGKIVFLDSIVLENGGVKQLIETMLRPVLNRPRYQSIRRWRDIGDPSMDSREQSNSDHRASAVIELSLNTTFELGVMDWDTRREGLKEMFARNIEGTAMLQVNPRITEGQRMNWLLHVFSGGYCYPVNPSGMVTRDGPLKNVFSHPGDAVSHGMPVLFGHIESRPSGRTDDTKVQKRAKGYAVA